MRRKRAPYQFPGRWGQFKQWFYWNTDYIMAMAIAVGISSLSYIITYSIQHTLLIQERQHKELIKALECRCHCNPKP